jgi:hypothetical protein
MLLSMISLDYKNDTWTYEEFYVTPPVLLTNHLLLLIKILIFLLPYFKKSSAFTLGFVKLHHALANRCNAFTTKSWIPVNRSMLCARFRNNEHGQECNRIKPPGGSLGRSEWIESMPIGLTLDLKKMRHLTTGATQILVANWSKPSRQF